MPNLETQKRDTRYGEVIKSIPEWYQGYDVDIYQIDQPHLSGWGQIEKLQQSSSERWLTVCNTPAANDESYRESRKVIPCDWSEKKNPSTQAGLLNSEEEQLQELILQFKTSRSISIQYRESLANRLVALLHDAKEEVPDCLGMAVGSLHNFISFLQSNTRLRCPTISLTPEYNLYATWRGEEGRLFSVHFLPSGDARFVIFKPNRKHPERKTIDSGTTTTDILMDTVERHSVQKWIFE